MKTIMFCFFSFIFFSNTNAQIGIGTTTPNNTAALDISDSTRGLLIPRMTMVKRQAILNPAKGLLVYQTDNPQGLWSYNGSAWSNLTNTGSPVNAGFAHHQLRSTTGNIIVVYTNSNAYAFVANFGTGPTWYPIALTGTPIGSIILDNIAVIYTATTAFSFTTSGTSGVFGWHSQAITGTPQKIIGINEMVVLATTTNLYGAGFNNGGVWNIQPILSPVLGVTTRGTLAPYQSGVIAMYTASSAYAYVYTSGTTGQWYSQALSGTAVGISSGFSPIVVYTTTNAYDYGSGIWQMQPLTGTGMGAVPN